MLEAAGWIVQSRDAVNLYAGEGVAVREVPTPTGPADYVLFLDRRACAVLAAKPEGVTLLGVAPQGADYAAAAPTGYPHWSDPLPFLYLSTGTETLFEGGAGERLRRRLLRDFDFHTLLRLPTGIFYRPGVKANVLFFDRRPRREAPWTEALWVYDRRTNKRFTLKDRPLRRPDLEEFVSLARLAGRHERQDDPTIERWRRYGYEELATRDKADLNLQWLRDDKVSDPATLPPPAEIAAEIADELEAAASRLRRIAARLGA